MNFVKCHRGILLTHFLTSETCSTVYSFSSADSADTSGSIFSLFVFLLLRVPVESAGPLHDVPFLDISFNNSKEKEILGISF